MAESFLVRQARAMAERVMNRVRVRRWQAYRALFGVNGQRSMDAEIVLADLRDFCRARVSTFDADQRVHALMEGRREVWLRIINALGLEEDELARLDARRDQLLEENDDE